MSRFHSHGITTKGRYRWLSEKTGSVVCISVNYRIGGTNYSTYKTDPRGIYVSIGTLDREYNPETNVVIEKWAAFSFPTLFVKELKKYSEKEIQKVMTMIDPHLDELAQLWKTDKNAAFEKFKSIFASTPLGV